MILLIITIFLSYFDKCSTIKLHFPAQVTYGKLVNGYAKQHNNTIHYTMHGDRAVHGGGQLRHFTPGPSLKGAPGAAP